MLLNAGVILKRTGDKIEDVSIKSVTETEIIYISTNGEEISILKSDVSAVLYDDGRYEEFKVSQLGSNDTSVPKEESNNNNNFSQNHQLHLSTCRYYKYHDLVRYL